MKKINTLIIFVLISGVSAVYSQSNETVKWNDGKRDHRLQVVPNTVIEFGNNINESGSEIKKADKSARRVKKSKTFSVWKVSDKQKVKSVWATRSTQRTRNYKKSSPMFKDRSGRTIAFPGNIVVAFKKDMTQEMVLKWAQERNLTVIRKVSHFHNSYLIKTNPGMETLEVVNTISGDEKIKSVNPNIWTKMSHR